MARRHWLLASGPTGADVPGQRHPWRWCPKIFLVGWRFGSEGRVVPRFGIWRNITQRQGLMASGSLSGSCLEGRDFSVKGMCLRGGHRPLASGPTFAHTVDNADAKYVDTDALGGRVTCTANVTIRPMGPMVSLALPRSPRPTKRRAGRFSQLY